MAEFRGTDARSALTHLIGALQGAELDVAWKLADSLLKTGVSHPAVFAAIAARLEQQGHFAEALSNYEKARTFVLGYPDLLRSLGVCLLRLNRLPDALQAMDRALALKPEFAAAHYLKGHVLGETGDAAEAERAYLKAIELESQHAEALGGLAALAARRGDSNKAKDFANRALIANPTLSAPLLSLAIAEIADGKPERAELHLKGLLNSSLVDPQLAAMAHAVRGDALDKQEKFAQAFDSYSKSRQILRHIHSPFFAKARAIDAARSLNNYFLQSNAEHWKTHSMTAQAGRDLPRQHVFLLGFMRSGTTLLGQILDRHPMAVTLDERDFLSDANTTYMTSANGLDRLASAGEPELQSWRNRYWASIRSFNPDISNKIFIDKLPFNTVKLPLIARLFPHSKILFAVRDPRDVIFSSFRRHFSVNATMFEFLSLDDSARFYSAIMALAETYRARLQLQLLEYRFEDLVDDFDGVVKNICGFVGLDYRPDLRNFSAAAAGADIRNPSAAQIRQPLNSAGIGVWKRYKDQLQVIEPIVEPWLKRFKYADG